MKPDLPAAERRRQLDNLFAPIHNPDFDCSGKAVLLGFIFQILLVSRLSDAAVRLSTQNE
jgi:hypothetical protein